MRYTVCHDERKGLALLFETTDTDEVKQLPELASLFPKGYFVRAVDRANPNRYYNSWSRQTPPADKKPDMVMVSATLIEQEPDRAKPDEKLAFMFEGKPYEVRLRARYNACLSLFKATGCSTCPDRGIVCLSEAAGFSVPSAFSQPVENDEEFLERVEKQYPKLGDFEFTSPISTKTRSFAERFRKYWEHNFEEIEQNAKDMSNRATQAAETRKFKQINCKICPINDSCDRARHCSGPYPKEDVIIKQCNEELADALKSSEWPEWQLWEMARSMGETAKHSRWNIILTGLKLQGGKIVGTVHRAKGSIEEYGKLKTYEDIAKVFKLALTEKDVDQVKRGPLKDPTLRAILWLTLNSSRAHQSYGWGQRRYVCGIGVTNSHIEVEWTNGSYLSYGGSQLEKISHVASKLTDGHLGNIDHIRVR